MTTLDQSPTAAAAPEPARASSARPSIKGNPWLPTPGGVWLVTGIELRRRRPTPKGWIFYGALFAAIMAIGVFAATQSDGSKNSTLLELVLVMVLGAGLLVAPSLSATSLNGDSGEGVLAPLQMTRLTAGDLALGKLIASWLFALAVLVTTTPLLVYAFSRSGWHWDELLLVLGVILLVVLTATALGLAWSALAARAVASVSLAHLTTGFLTLGTLLLFFFTQPLVSETVVETQRSLDWEAMSAEESAAVEAYWMNGDVAAFDAIDVNSLACVETTYNRGVAHTEQTAWLLLANPVVLIGESSPIVNPNTWQEDGRAAPGLFGEMHSSVSDARIGPSQADLEDYTSYDECADLAAQVTGDQAYLDEQQAYWDEQNAAYEAERERNATYPRAPWVGLAVQGVLLVGAMWIVVHRLRVPYRKMRTGTRVA